MINIGGLLLGVINIAIMVAILILVGLLIVWFLSFLSYSVPDNIRKVYMAIVALIALYMFVALLLGMPTWRIVGGVPFWLASSFVS